MKFPSVGNGDMTTFLNTITVTFEVRYDLLEPRIEVLQGYRRQSLGHDSNLNKSLRPFENS